MVSESKIVMGMKHDFRTFRRTRVRAITDGSGLRALRFPTVLLARFAASRRGGACGWRAKTG